MPPIQIQRSRQTQTLPKVTINWAVLQVRNTKTRNLKTICQIGLAFRKNQFATTQWGIHAEYFFPRTNCYEESRRRIGRYREGEWRRAKCLTVKRHAIANDRRNEEWPSSTVERLGVNEKLRISDSPTPAPAYPSHYNHIRASRGGGTRRVCQSYSDAISKNCQSSRVLDFFEPAVIEPHTILP